MSEKDKITEEKIKHAGIFDFKETYNFVYNWLIHNEYFVEEKAYVEKIKPDGKEIEIEWQAFRKISDYFRFILKFRWFIVGLNDAEIVRDGVKIKSNKGVFEVKIDAILEKDYESNWDATAFSKFMRGLYDKYIIRSRTEQYEDKIAGEMAELVAQIKAFLALESRK
jgi:hypothetical protein